MFQFTPAREAGGTTALSRETTDMFQFTPAREAGASALVKFTETFGFNSLPRVRREGSSPWLKSSYLFQFTPAREAGEMRHAFAVFIRWFQFTPAREAGAICWQHRTTPARVSMHSRA